MAKIKTGKVGIFILTMLVTGNIVGSGVLLLPSSLAKYGSIGILSWILTSVGAIFLALVFAKMSSVMPKTGGPYAYVRAEFGEYLGFQTAYSYWIAVWAGNAALVTALVSYLAVFFPILRVPHVALIAGLGFLWLFTLTNVFGVRRAGIFGVVITILKFSPLVLIAVFGWWHFHPQYITSSFNVSGQSDFSALTAAGALTLWSFVGVETASIPAGDVNNPSKTIPIATITGALLAAVIYILCCIVIMGMVPMQELQGMSSPFAYAGGIIFGVWGKYIIAAGAVFAIGGALNGWTLLQSQVAMAAADDHLFPKLFSIRNKYGVPIWGLIITSIIISVVLVMTSSFNLVKEFEILILAATTMTVIPYFYTAVAQIVYMISNKKFEPKAPLNIFIAVIGGIYSFWAISGTTSNVIYYVTLLLLFSIPLYAIVRCQRLKKQEVDAE